MSMRKTNHKHDQHSPDRQRRISQFSKDIPNMGHESHQWAHSDKGEKHRRHSQQSHHTNTDMGDNNEKSEKSRRISHYSREHGHLKDATLRGQGQGHHHYGRSRAGSKREHDRHSVATSGDFHPPPMVEFENTYRLEPEATFLPDKVKVIIRDVFKENLQGQKYDRNLMGSRCMVLSDIIKEKVRQMNLHRYKIVSMVVIGERKDQSMLVSSRCLWNHSYDNFASCEYYKDNLCAVGMVFAVYQE